MKKQSDAQPRFYRFSSKLVMAYFLAGLVDEQVKTCKIDSERSTEFDLDYRLIKGQYKGLRFPIQFKQTDGKKLTDFLDTGFPNVYLISDRTKDLLEEHQFTGYSIYPAIVRDKRDQVVHGYHGFSIIGRCGPIDYSKSEIIEKKWVETGPLCKFYKGITIDEWDGSDFFSPTDSRRMLTTERVVRTFKQQKITNLKYAPLDEYEVDVDLV